MLDGQVSIWPHRVNGAAQTEAGRATKNSSNTLAVPWKQDGPLGSSAAQGVQVHLDLLATTQHPNGGIEATRGHHRIFLANDLSVACEEHLRVGARQRGGVGERQRFR